jgi:hypothetical protein
MVDKEKACNELLILFERLITIMEETKKIKVEAIASELLFKIYEMNSNNRSKLFSDSASWLDSNSAIDLLDEGFIQRIGEDYDKYTLTLKGIAYCIEKKYGKLLDEQFVKFLELSDNKFILSGETELTWKEKLATLSLILLSSTSSNSAIFLTNEYNKGMFNEVFEKTLACLKRFGIINESEKLGTVSRGESPVSALMSRLQTLSSKTNYYYKFVGKGSIYYVDIEDNGEVVEKKMFFLLRKIFENYNPACNYEEMNRELAEISQRYSPRFQERTIKPSVMFSILKALEDFLDVEIRRLPEKSNNSFQ